MNAKFEAALRWRSRHASHCDRRYFAAADLRRHDLPGDLAERLAHCAAGETVSIEMKPGEALPDIDARLRRSLRSEQFKRVMLNGVPIELRYGRFYPCSLLLGVPDVSPGERRGFRCTGRDADRFEADLNHPLAGVPLTVEITPLPQSGSIDGPGEPVRNIAAALADNGPGMQAPPAAGDTDFFSGNPFARSDEGDDTLFYRAPRLVHHLDATAIERVRALYGRLLVPGMAVLDLMSSWTSHLPSDIEGLRVTGLGMNREELERNSRLAHRVVHDLNHDPVLPFGNAEFDAALCTVSVEYLTRTSAVFREAARVLKPGAPFLVTFSERWFPPKVVRIWTELHPFERMGLVLDYFRRCEGFTALASESVRGLPRPPDDKYARVMPFSDSIYAVWGARREESGVMPPAPVRADVRVSRHSAADVILCRPDRTGPRKREVSHRENMTLEAR